MSWSGLDSKPRDGFNCVGGIKRLTFGHSEVSVDCAKHTRTSPEEARLCPPVPGSWVEHVRREDIGDETSDVVEIAGENNGLVAKPCGRDLRD